MSAAGGAIFGPRAITNNLGRGPLGEAMYQISKALVLCFQKRRFLKFFPIRVYVCTSSDPRRRAFFDPRAIISSIFGRGQLNEATYQISQAPGAGPFFWTILAEVH